MIANNNPISEKDIRSFFSPDNYNHQICKTYIISHLFQSIFEGHSYVEESVVVVMGIKLFIAVQSGFTEIVNVSVVGFNMDDNDYRINETIRKIYSNNPDVILAICSRASLAALKDLLSNLIWKK